MSLFTLATVVLVPLLSAWVAALAAGDDWHDQLDAWDNGLAHLAGPACCETDHG